MAIAFGAVALAGFFNGRADAVLAVDRRAAAAVRLRGRRHRRARVAVGHACSAASCSASPRTLGNQWQVGTGVLVGHLDVPRRAGVPPARPARIAGANMTGRTTPPSRRGSSAARASATVGTSLFVAATVVLGAAAVVGERRPRSSRSSRCCTTCRSPRCGTCSPATPGLVSVGQQGFVGVGAYATVRLRRAQRHRPVAVARARRPVRRGPVGAGRAVRVPARGRLLRDRHVGDRRGVPARDPADRLDRRRQRAVASRSATRGPATDLETRNNLIYWVALALGVGATLLSFLVVRSRLGLAPAGDARQRRRRQRARRQRASARSDRVGHRRRVDRHDRRADPSQPSTVTDRTPSASSAGRRWSSSWW